MRPSSEALLLSALINSGDIQAAEIYGLRPDMMHGYQSEYRWALSYRGIYGKTPTAESLKHKFPGFPITEHADVPFLAEEVLRKHTKREQVLLIKEAATLLQEDDVEGVSGLLMTYTPMTVQSPLTNSLHDRTFLDDYAPRQDGLVLPWKTLQRLTGGVRPGDLFYIAMRLGQGKSWVLAACVAFWLMMGQRVLIYSLEMPAEQIRIRIHVLLGRMLGFNVDHVSMRDRVYDRILYTKIMDAIADQVPGELYIEDQGQVTPNRIKSQIDQADVTVVDYVGLMSNNKNDPAIRDWRVAAEISNSLKGVALEHKSRLVLAAQINREGDSEGKKPPSMKTLSQSDAIGQDADVVVTSKRFSKESNVYLVAKNRHGEDNQLFYTNFKPNTGDFDEIQESFAVDLRYSEQD